MEDDIPILSPMVMSEAERLIDQYNIDFLDAFQIVVVKKGQFHHADRGSKTLLITADRELARASRKEGLDVWCCIDEQAPKPNESQLF